MTPKALTDSFYDLFSLIAESPITAQETSEYAVDRCRHLAHVKLAHPDQFEACLIAERDNVALATANQAMRTSQQVDDRIKAIIYGAMRVGVDALL